MQFVIDENSWRFGGLPAHQVLDSLEDLLDRLDDAQVDGHHCFYSEDLFHEPVLEGLSFYELYGPGSPLLLPRELQERLAVAFARLNVWQDEAADWPAKFEVTIEGGEEEFAPSIAWAHSQSSNIRTNSIGCFVLNCRRSEGAFVINLCDNFHSIWFIGRLRTYERYFRFLIVQVSTTPGELENLSKSAFKNLAFVPGCFNGIKRMGGGYENVICSITRHLSAFSDEGVRIFGGERSRVAAEFGPLGVDISDENGGTKQNRKARAERVRVFEGEEREFWWHSKLERHQNRIHICPDDVLDKHRIVVGIFCGHLTV